MKVTLTFDNGPWLGVTEAVLDELASRDLKSTFFVVGQQLRRDGGRQLAERATSEGHWIGNHTLTHSVTFGDGADPREEIGVAEDLIDDLAHEPKWFRPYGRGGVIDERLLSAPAIDYLVENAYSCVLWNCVPRDWEDPDAWIARALSDVRANDWTVVVLHDLPTGAMDRLPVFLDQLDAMDAQVVQGFPDDCVPIRGGAVIGDVSRLAAAT